MRHAARALCAAATAALLACPAPAQLPRTPKLTLAVARQMIDGCVEMAGKNGWKVAIVVKDAGDAVVASARMDGAALGTMDGATSKAAAAARLATPTATLAKFAFDPKTGQPTAGAFIPGTALFAGGLPIVVDGTPIGAIGVSGVLPLNDERCAQAGIDAAKAGLR